MDDVVASAQSAELLGWSPRRTMQTLAGGAPLILYVRFSTDGAAVSDLGATLASLQPLSPQARDAASRICHRNDVQIEGGALLAHVPPGGDLTEAVERLERACAELSRTASAAASPGA
jgi:hypothetical protein